VSAPGWLAQAAAALRAFLRGFVGVPAHASHCTSAREARAALREAAERRGRCC